MAALPLDKHLARLACCRPDGDPLGCRKTRDALARMAVDPSLREAFAGQAGFDGPMAASVRALPLPLDFEENVQAGLRRAGPPAASSWRGMLRQPALWAALLAVGFLVAWGGWALYERANGFQGDDTVRQIVESAFKPRYMPLESLDTECGKLGDTLFLRHNLEDFEVPPAFAHEMMAGYRVFENNNNPVTQVKTRDGGLIFLVFRADSQGVDITPEGAWKHLDGDDWTAAAEVHNHICFVAVTRGKRAEIDSRLRLARN